MVQPFVPGGHTALEGLSGGVECSGVEWDSDQQVSRYRKLILSLFQEDA